MIRCRFGFLRLLVLAVMILGLAGSAAAQEDAPDFWGTGTNFHFVNANEFQSADPYYDHWRRTTHGFWYFDGVSWCDGWATVRLPTGALLTGMTVIYSDTDPDFNLTVDLWRQWVTAAGVKGSALVAEIQSSGVPGTTATWVDIVPDHTVKYMDGSTAQSYVLQVHSWLSDLQVRGVIIGWNRQISPAPVVPTFPDVAPGYWAFQEIEALAASGITTGFPDGTFRPTAAVTRAQMATFLARALGLHWAP